MGEHLYKGVTQGEIMSDWEQACSMKTSCVGVRTAQKAEKSTLPSVIRQGH